jgi:hypothetical protein
MPSRIFRKQQAVAAVALLACHHVLKGAHQLPLADCQQAFAYSWHSRYVVMHRLVSLTLPTGVRSANRILVLMACLVKLG